MTIELDKLIGGLDEVASKYRYLASGVYANDYLGSDMEAYQKQYMEQAKTIQILSDALKEVRDNLESEKEEET